MKSKLPDCQLIEILRTKASARADIEFDYLSRLEELRNRIGGEVRFINQLFPEYTPHDEEYHLSRLFHVADTLIGLERYETMNATELFVLACGLYGHDWGMAVSEAERDYIVSGVLPDGFSPSDFALLHDEHKGFEGFVKERGLAIDEIRAKGVSIEDWREYVRRTHAFRSGERVRHYFQKIDSGVAEAGGRVCEGHWLNIEELQDFHRYPTNFAVLRENLDLAAIAVYVRLVDLLDIGHDRTPYVIWKFVAPRDRYSKMEWNKHRALQPITCPTYMKGRVVLVDGSTDDHEVYAALEDLRSYCEKQVRDCMNLLAQIGDPRHLLDLYHIEWRVVARGFDPVLVRFEFDRERVFEILSSEIYQGDPYVFLRELLQNSIDAIRIRRELVERYGGITLDRFGLIRVKVEHGSGGDARVTWSDDGVGMDAYVVQNYLAVAGRSYYRSEEFERQGLKLDPISRFGVGILSCFMVADLVEIETCKDPYTSSTGGALRIKIPSLTSQFRIEKCSPLDFGIGTRVTVHVEGRRLPEDTKSLDVTSYLKAIAGFVEFPILISENDQHTVVLHPKSGIDPSEDTRFQFYPNIEWHQTSLDYPIEEVMLPHYLETARVELVEVAFDLTQDLSLPDYEGRITYLEPRDENCSLSWSSNGAEGLALSHVGDKEALVRWNREWTSYHWGARSGKELSRSADSPITYSIYRDGLLIPGASLPRDYGYSRTLTHKFPLPRMVINLPTTQSTQLDIARVELRTTSEHWFEPIRKALELRLKEKLVGLLGDTPTNDDFARMGLFSTTYGFSRSLLRELPSSHLPVGILTTHGSFASQRWEAWGGKAVRICPEVFNNELQSLIHANELGEKYEGYLEYWQGGDVVIKNLDYYGDVRIRNAISITNMVLEELFVLSRVAFLQSPNKGLPPLVEEIWQAKDPNFDRSTESIAEQAINDPQSLTSEECDALLNDPMFYHNTRIVAFPPCDSVPFRVGNHLFNLAHPLVELGLRSMAWLLLLKKKRDANSGRLLEAVNQLISYHPGHELPTLTAAANALLATAPKLGLSVDSPISSQLSNSELWHSSKVDFHHSARSCKEPFGEPLEF